MYVDLPISKLFAELAEPTDGRVTFSSLLTRFGNDSLAIAVLVAGVIGMAPGVSMISGAFLIFCAVEIFSGRDGAAIPSFITQWSLPSRQVSYVLREAQPWLRYIEESRRNAVPMPALAKRACAIPIFVLSLTLFVPVPFTNVIPSAVIGAIALACLLESRVLLFGALAGAAGSFAATVATISIVVGAGHFAA